MTDLMQSEVFFFISSIGFIILTILAATVLVFVLRAFRSFSKILDKAEKDIDAIGDTTKDMLEEMRDSSVFRFVFQGRKKHKKS
ncbi:MAG: Uncharacterized protein G01um101449_7 [Parcubacteria group bacterium Gr01-1014_49]|nr:MAG: Uncharacterized protein G01um101449_7 [Parcubacteria group bacterium Gr01-1014_49]